MKKTICILIATILLLSCLPVMATESLVKENVPMSTFAEVNAMFPEAKLINPEENGNLFGKSIDEIFSTSADAVAVETYTKKIEGDIHYLEVFEDGSYLVYGMVDDCSSVTSTRNYTEYDNVVVYYNNMYPGISMSFKYDYRVNNSTLYNEIMGARNNSTSDSNPLYTGHFNNTVYASKSHAYGTADVTKDETGDVIGDYRVGVRASKKDLYVYREN